MLHIATTTTCTAFINTATTTLTRHPTSTDINILRIRTQQVHRIQAIFKFRFNSHLLRTVTQHLHNTLQPKSRIIRISSNSFLILLPKLLKIPRKLLTTSHVRHRFRHPTAISHRSVLIPVTVNTTFTPKRKSSPSLLTQHTTTTISHTLTHNIRLTVTSSHRRSPLLLSRLHHTLTSGSLAITFRPIISIISNHLTKIRTLTH